MYLVYGFVFGDYQVLRFDSFVQAVRMARVAKNADVYVTMCRSDELPW